MKLTDAEWSVLEILWSGDNFSLKEIQANGWNKNTVHTYLTRMEKKGLVKIERGAAKPYSAAVSRDDCAKNERDELLKRVYGGATGDMIAVFLKESKITSAEVMQLRALLDDMEV